MKKFALDTPIKERSLFEYYGFTERDAKKYPVVSRILKQLTPERIKKEIEAVQKVKLPPELQRWVKEYEKVGERNEFIWKWLYRMFHIVRLSGVPKKWQEDLYQIKVLLTMFVVQLDDVADKKQNKRLLNEILKIPLNQSFIKFNLLNRKEKIYLSVTISLWNYIEKTISKYPRYKEFKDIFEYDITQVLNAINYSYLVNKNPHLINKAEYWLYLPSNMVFMVYLTINLMYSPKSNLEKLGIFREMICEVQKMGRVGNWIGTWEREIKDGDFTSGVFAYSIEKGILTSKEFQGGNKNEIIKKIKKSDIEHYLLIKWEEFYNEIGRLSKKIKLMDIKKLLKELEYLLTVELATWGYK